GAEGMLVGMGNQPLDQIVRNGNVSDPDKHEPREDEACAERRRMLYGRLLLDRFKCQLRGLVGEAPKPSDRRQSATDTGLGMTVESEIGRAGARYAGQSKQDLTIRFGGALVS